MKLSKSLIGTLLVIIVIITIIYISIASVFLLSSHCYQKHTGSLNFDLLYSCSNTLIYISIAYFLLCLFILFILDRKRAYFDHKGVIISQVFLILLVLYFVYYLIY